MCFYFFEKLRSPTEQNRVFYRIMIVIIIKWFADNIVKTHRIFRYFNFSSLFLTSNDKITYNGLRQTPVSTISYQYYQVFSISVDIFSFVDCCIVFE